MNTKTKKKELADKATIAISDVLLRLICYWRPSASMMNWDKFIVVPHIGASTRCARQRTRATVRPKCTARGTVFD